MSLPQQAVVNRTVENLRARGFEVHVVRTGAEAKAKVLELIPAGAEVANGTSTTLNQIGLVEALSSGQYDYWWLKYRDEPDPAKRTALRRRAALADYFLGSVNAIAESGEVVAADFSGSRVGAYPFTAGKVIWVSSANKITADLPAALARVEQVALPLEEKRVKDQGGQGSRINKLLIYQGESVRGRVHLVLITGEEYGF